eukprot:CCRYP_012512-RA/>CCRYP_012512-RA protein AED:0.45 eAED:0.45 QI:0/0/0/1/0/0/2/0/209
MKRLASKMNFYGNQDSPRKRRKCQNIKGRSLRREWIEDAAFECTVIRATLDAFWARQRGTIKSHVREVKNIKRMARAMGFDPFPPLGPYPLGEHLGMMQATLMEMRGLDKGQKGGTVQFGTARGVRSTCTVLWESSPAGGGDMVLSAGNVKGRYVLSRNPTESRWFELFTRGMSVRKGDVVEQDRAYSIEVLHELIRMYEDEWEEAQGE